MMWGPLVQSFGGCNDQPSETHEISQLAGMRRLPLGMTKLDHCNFRYHTSFQVETWVTLFALRYTDDLMEGLGIA